MTLLRFWIGPYEEPRHTPRSAYQVMVKASPDRPKGKTCGGCWHAFEVLEPNQIHCVRGPRRVTWSRFNLACGLYKTGAGRDRSYDGGRSGGPLTDAMLDDAPAPVPF